VKTGDIVRVIGPSLFKGLEGPIVDRPYNSPSGSVPVNLEGFGIQFFPPADIARVPRALVNSFNFA